MWDDYIHTSHNISLSLPSSPLPLHIDPYNLTSFIGAIAITIFAFAILILIFVLLVFVCKLCVQWTKGKIRDRKFHSYSMMQRTSTPSSTAESSQGLTAVINILYAAGDLLSYQKEPDIELIEALYHFLPVVLSRSEHPDALDPVQRVKRNLQILQLSLSLPGGGGGSGYDSDTANSTTDDQVPLEMSAL